MSWIRSQLASFTSKDAAKLNNNSQQSPTQHSQESSVPAIPPSDINYFELFWHDASVILCKPFQPTDKPVARTSLIDDCEIVIHFTGKMVKLLTDENSTVGCNPQLLDYFYSEEVLDKLLAFGRQWPEYRLRLVSHQLGIYDTLMSHSQHQLLIQTQFTRPLLSLLDDCKSDQIKDESVEEKLVSVLHQLCVAVSQNLSILDLLIESSVHDSNSKSFDLSMLLPFVHRTGAIGQQARDDLLLLMSLSSNYEVISRYITEKTEFCQVLVVSLSGLYSLLPRTLNYGSDDWHQITDDDIAGISDLPMFLNLLEFCSALVQVSHPSIQDQLLSFIFSGFLVSVIGPTLHQLDPITWSKNLNSEFGEALLLLLVQSGMEEAIAATAYLELSIRKIAEPRLLRVFLEFVLLGCVEEVTILEALIQRINSSNARLCMVTLTLFKTLVELNCEDVMYQLVFKYLLPCTHIMTSQQRSVTDIDVYCKAAEKLVSMIPSICCTDHHGDGCHGDEKLPTSGFNLDHRSSNDNPNIDDISLLPSFASSSSSTFQRPWNWFSFRGKPKSIAVDLAGVRGQADGRDSLLFDEDESPAVFPAEKCVQDSSLMSSKCLQPCGIGYSDYLQLARFSVKDCTVACRNWSSFYGGEGLARWSQGASILSPVSPAATDPPSTDMSYSDIIRVVRRRDAEESETDSSSACEEIPGSSVGRLSAKPVDDLVPFLIHLNRVFVPDGSELSDDVVAEFEHLVDTLAEMEPVLEVVDLVANNPSLHPEAVAMSCADGGSTASLPSFDSARSRQAVVFEAHSSPRCSEMIPADTALSVVTQSVVGQSKRYAMNREAPCIGPFLTAVLNRLESMRHHTLYVNLLLTGLITRLACYPQPLLSSLLLSPSLVFQPSVKSLMQVLDTVKYRIEEFLYKVKNKDHLFDHAYNFLNYRVSSHSRPSSCEETSMKPARRQSLMALGSPKPHTGETKISSLISRLSILDNKHAVRYDNNQNKQTSSDSAEAREILETKNAVYCAVVFKEFLKELAAISQEHALLMLQEAS